MLVRLAPHKLYATTNAVLSSKPRDSRLSTDVDLLVRLPDVRDSISIIPSNAITCVPQGSPSNHKTAL